MANKSKKYGLQWTCIVVLIVLWRVFSNTYKTFTASFEAGIAPAQVNDSILQYSLIQKIMYGDLFPFLINLSFLVLIILCLWPIVRSRDIFNKNS